MIIVNQKKDLLINFENIEEIYIQEELVDKTQDYKIPHMIYAGTGSGRIELGTYKTEEEAKKVFEEIIKKYLEFTAMTDRTGTHMTIIKNKPKAYIMPEAGE